MGDAAAPGVRLRTARREDVPAIVALHAADVLGASREDAADLAPYLAAFDAIAAAPGCDLLVAEDAATGAVVGCLELVLTPGLTHRGALKATLEGVQVAAQHRGRGIGAALVRHALDLARARGATKVALTSHRTRADAHRFYERLGFAGTHLGMKRDLLD